MYIKYILPMQIFIISLAILNFYVEGELQYVKGPKGQNPSCTTGSMVRNGIECKEACNQLKVAINGAGIMVDGTPCYITNSGMCRQKEEPANIANGALICRKSGY